MNEEKFQLALKWYTQGIIDAEGDIGDGISADFSDQYGDQFPESTPSESYYQKRCELETLKRVKDVCELYSDSSARTLAYHWVCEEISKLEALKSNPPENKEQDELWEEVESKILQYYNDQTGSYPHPGEYFKQSYSIKRK